jgi:hypothetical protein
MVGLAVGGFNYLTESLTLGTLALPILQWGAGLAAANNLIFTG